MIGAWISMNRTRAKPRVVIVRADASESLRTRGPAPLGLRTLDSRPAFASSEELTQVSAHTELRPALADSPEQKTRPRTRRSSSEPRSIPSRDFRDTRERY